MNRVLEWLFGVSSANLADADGWSLRFTGMPANASVLLGLLVLFGLLSWLTLGCYRREGVWPPRVKLTIASLRLAVLALLFLVVLQPALVIRFTRVQSGAVVVLVDDTLSMRWKDRYTDAKQGTALAALLGLPPDRVVGDDPLTRAEAVRLALASQDGALSRLGTEHPMLLFRFGVTSGGASSYIQPMGETEVGAGHGFPDLARQGLGNLKADGAHTDVGRAVREILNRLEGRRLTALVVVSDGRNTGFEKARLAGAVQMARQRNVPVYAVAVGDPVPPRNVAVTQLLGPREARAGSTLSFTALVTHRSMPKTTTEIRLWRCLSGREDWEDTGARAEVTLGGEPAAADPAGRAGQTGALQEIALAMEAPAVGTYVFKARIQPPREDSNPADNEATTLVHITDQKMKVLLVAAGPSWEFQFLRNYLLRSAEHYAVTAWQQNADRSFNQDASLGMKRTSLPTTIQQMREYDAAVLCDPRPMPGSFDERFLELLETFVGKSQGGLCYVAGHKFTGRTLARRGALEPMTAFLPVALAPENHSGARGADERETWPVALTSEGQTHPILKLAAEARDSMAIWRRMPGVYRCQKVSQIKPLASSLAVRGESGRAAQDPAEPVIAVQRYGNGRVLYLGFDGTWRWRAIDEGAHYERFWSNTMEFLGAGRLAKNRIVVSTAGDAFDAGSDIEVRIEASNPDLNPLEAKGVILDVRPLEGGESARHTIRRERPGVYSGAIRADRVGAYELDVKSDDTGAKDWTAQDVSTRRIQIRLPQAEFHRPEADTEALRELAGDDSRFVPLNELATLSAKIKPDPLAITTESPHPLWRTKAMLLLLGVLLLAEWTLRKIYKMM
jgi:hypothetical protein